MKTNIIQSIHNIKHKILIFKIILKITRYYITKKIQKYILLNNKVLYSSE